MALGEDVAGFEAERLDPGLEPVEEGIDVVDAEAVLEVGLEPVEGDVAVVDDGEHVGVRGGAEGADHGGADVGAAGSVEGEAAERFEVDEDGGVAVDRGAEWNDGGPWVRVDVGGVGERRVVEDASPAAAVVGVVLPSGGRRGGFGEDDDDVVVVDDDVAGAQHGCSCGEFVGEMAERGVGSCGAVEAGGGAKDAFVLEQLAVRQGCGAAVGVVGLAAAAVPVDGEDESAERHAGNGQWDEGQLGGVAVGARRRRGLGRLGRCRRAVRRLGAGAAALATVGTTCGVAGAAAVATAGSGVAGTRARRRRAAAVTGSPTARAACSTVVSAEV